MTCTPEAVLDLVVLIRQQIQRSPGLSSAPFSPEAWVVVEKALRDSATMALIEKFHLDVRVDKSEARGREWVVTGYDGLNHIGVDANLDTAIRECAAYMKAVPQ